MYFLYIKIIDIDYKEDVFLALENADINKASYVEGTNLDNALTRDLPLFKGFFKNEDDKAKQVYIVNALVEEKEQITEFLNLLKESGLDYIDKGILRVLAWPVEVLIG